MHFPSIFKLLSTWIAMAMDWSPLKASLLPKGLVKGQNSSLMDQSTWRQILLKEYLHTTGRSRAQRTPEELPWPSRGVERRGWDVDFKEEGYLSHTQPSVRKTVFPGDLERWIKFSVFLTSFEDHVLIVYFGLKSVSVQLILLQYFLLFYFH